MSAGTYREAPPAWTVPLALVATGAVVLDGTGLTASLALGKALLVPCADTTITGPFKITGVAMDQEGAQGTAAIRPDTGCGFLTLDGVELTGNQFGVFTGADMVVQIMVKNSNLHGNGLPAPNSGNGYTHNIYTGAATILILENTTSVDPVGGHGLKNRGPSTTITGSTISATDATAIDQPDGGVLTIKDTTLVKPAGSANHGVIGYAMESTARGTQGATITGGVIDAECDSPIIQGAKGTTVTLSGVTFKGTKPTADTVTVNGL